MKTLKKQFKQENIDSNNLHTIITNYSKKDCVRIALYTAEDCFHLHPTKEARTCINLIKKWLKDKKSVKREELKTAAASAADTAYSAANAAYSAANAAYSVDATYATYSAAQSFGNKKEFKLEEYRNYARLFAYEDLDFPHRDFAKTFNLDNHTDLNIFLDFLIDHYPEAITFKREEYFKSKLPKEELRILYQ